MEPLPSRFEKALTLIDAVHREDPQVEVVEGIARPSEALYAERMSAWVERLQPDASELLRLAVRCQHLRRWTIPRDRYPTGRLGYHQWRTAQAEAHARLAGELLKEAGYEEMTVARIQSLIRKERLRRDPEAQCLEDAACLVFLEHALPGFARRHDEAQVIDILQKTWNKMSPRAREEALRLKLTPHARALLDKALAGT
ncbi:MAG: DUF4202 domain-containing protein [Pseudomonadota bacterium]